MDNVKKALVFNKVQSSFVDGYGIRTTVFLKGCPLKCIWCCNPEGQSFQPELKVSYEKCNGCGRCIDACPQKALRLEDGIVVVDRALCNGCGQCIESCYTGALDMFGVWMTVDEVFNIIKKDEMFFKSTGGGATIGGGEATCYPEFMLELIEKCHKNNIHVAVDTCGYVTSELGLEVLKVADLLLFDIKGLDPVRHEQNTGKSNDVILKNLKLMSDIRKPMIIRIPVITGYNDDDANLTAVAELLKTLHSVERVDLIPVHEFGKVKYEQIGMPYRLKADPIPEERQEELRQKFESYGFLTQIGG